MTIKNFLALLKVAMYDMARDLSIFVVGGFVGAAAALLGMLIAFRLWGAS